jgi:glycolate oxidase FAD binding subunit
MTEVTLKVLPAPETEETVLIRGLEPGKAIAAMTGAMTAPCDISGAAHLPAEVAARLPAGSAASGGAAVTALRLEGFAPSVAHRRGLTEALMKPFGELVTLDAPASRTLWKAVRDAGPLGFAHSIHPPLKGEGRIGAGKATQPAQARLRGDPGRGLASDPHPIASRSTSPLQGEVTRNDERPLWRISTEPSRGAELGALIAREAEAQMLYDWAGGLLWLALEACDDAGMAIVGRAVAAIGGHATLIRAPAAVRAAVDVFPVQDAAVAALTKRIKAGFDPSGVLNPGRMWAGV